MNFKLVVVSLKDDHKNFSMICPEHTVLFTHSEDGFRCYNKDLADCESDRVVGQGLKKHTHLLCKITCLILFSSTSYKFVSTMGDFTANSRWLLIHFIGFGKSN